MRIAPNRVSLVAELTRAGWDTSQANQLAWVDFWEYGRDGRGTRGYSFSRPLKLELDVAA